MFSYVEWECEDRPLQEETMYYLDYVLASVSYAELLCSSRLWVTGEYQRLCVGTLTGSEELLAALALDARVGSYRLSSIAFCLEQMCREWEAARETWYLFPYRSVSIPPT